MEKIFLDNGAVPCCPGGQIANFVKKMYFLGRKWHFFEKNNVLDILIGVSLGMRSLHIYNIW